MIDLLATSSKTEFANNEEAPLLGIDTMAI
jgi:hypothetical protein